MLFVSMQMQGIPMYDGLAVNEDNNINMKVNYFNMNNTPLNPMKLNKAVIFMLKQVLPIQILKVIIKTLHLLDISLRLGN